MIEWAQMYFPPINLYSLPRMKVSKEAEVVLMEHYYKDKGKK